MAVLPMPAVAGVGLVAQQGINLLQVAALRIPCFMASLASIIRVAEVALRGISQALQFIGFTGESTFSRWVTSGVDHVRPYKNADTKKLILEALALAAIGVVGHAFVSALFGAPPAIYNTVLQWLGPVRVTPDMHPIIQILSQKFFS